MTNSKAQCRCALVITSVSAHPTLILRDNVPKNDSGNYNDVSARESLGQSRPMYVPETH